MNKFSFLFATVSILCIAACRKDPAIMNHVTLQGNPVITPVVVADPRDTIAGDYTGTMHYVQTAVWGAYTTIDTTYPYTLHVIIDTTTWSNPNSLWMDGIQMDKDSSYAVHL